MENLSCPKCNGELEEKTVGEEIKLQQCNKCKGLFVPPGATKKILANWKAKENPDTGSVAVGEKFDQIDDIDCPKCSVRMDKVQDQEQPHIWTENCPRCGSTFFDAGEMTDLKEKTLSDLFKKIFPKKRA